MKINKLTIDLTKLYWTLSTEYKHNNVKLKKITHSIHTQHVFNDISKP